MVAAHCGDAPDDFVVADNVELPWPSAQGDMAWEWRVVSLKDIFMGEIQALCVQDRDLGPEEDLGGGRMQMQATSPKAVRKGLQEQEDGQPAGRGAGESSRENPAIGRGTRITSVPLAFAAVEGRPGSELVVERQERDDVIGVDAEPPLPPGRQAHVLSLGSESRHTGLVRLRRCWERGR